MPATRDKQRIVIFSGPDRCGKTEISTALSAWTGIPRFKASSEHDAFLSSKVTKRELFLNQLRYADPRVVDMLAQTGQSVIFDRGFPCEWCYSRVLGRETDEKMLWHLDGEWARLGARIVVCHRSSYVGVQDDLDPTVDEHKLQSLDAAYREFAQRTKCPCYFLNVDDQDLVREVDEVTCFMGYDALTRLSIVSQMLGLYKDRL